MIALALFGVFGEGHTTHIHVGTSAILIWETIFTECRPRHLLWILEHFHHVVVVYYRKITYTFLNGFNLSPIIALGFACQVTLEAGQPSLGFCLTMMGNHARGQCNHVDMLPRAGADTTFPFGIGQLLVGCDFTGFDAIFRRHNNASPRCQSKPVTFRLAIVLGDVLLESRRINRLSQSRVLDV